MRSHGLVALRSVLILLLAGFLLMGGEARSHGGGSHGAPSSGRSASLPEKSNHSDWIGEKETTQRPMQAPHGGQITATNLHYFEVVYFPAEIRIYPFLPSQRPMNARGITGEVVLHVKSSSQSLRRPIQCVARPTWTDDLGYLAATVDVSQVHDGDMEVTFDLKHLSTREESRVRFVQTFALTQPPLLVTAAPLTEADRPAVMRQRVCPVTNTLLGEHGAPIKLVAAEQPLYVCCDECVAQVQIDPRTYLGKAAAASRQGAPGPRRPQIAVTYATPDDRPAVQAQGVCAVTGRPLGDGSEPIKIMLDSRPLFVCSWECVRSVGQAPEAYLGKVASGIGAGPQLAPPRAIVAGLTQADEIAVRAQGRCPVSDQPLGAHGPPIKLLVDGRPLFVCCQGCVCKVQENPDRYLAGVGSRRIAPAPRDWSISGSACATCSASGRPDNTGCSGPACESRFSRRALVERPIPSCRTRIHGTIGHLERAHGSHNSRVGCRTV